MKCVVVLSVLDTEDLKPKLAVEERASDGMLKHLINMLEHHLRNLILVWNRIIAETQIMKKQFGATQQMQLQDLNIVTQLIKVCLSAMIVSRN